MKRTILAVATLLVGSSLGWSTIFFDNFNTNEGHFATAPNYSGSSRVDPASTADRVTTDSPFEGAGHQKLVFVPEAAATIFRVRFLSGVGSPSYNTPFTTTAGTDGWIGFYLKTTATGWHASLNLDGPNNVLAEMDGSTGRPIIADGQWHLYEWNLDAAEWGLIPAIGGGHAGNLLVNGQHTIDSVYFRDLDGTVGPTATIYFDFLAKSDTGSIAALVPEPGPLAFAAFGGFTLCLAGMRRK